MAVSKYPSSSDVFKIYPFKDCALVRETALKCSSRAFVRWHLAAIHNSYVQIWGKLWQWALEAGCFFHSLSCSPNAFTKCQDQSMKAKVPIQPVKRTISKHSPLSACNPLKEGKNCPLSLSLYLPSGLWVPISVADIDSVTSAEDKRDLCYWAFSFSISLFLSPSPALSKRVKMCGPFRASLRSRNEQTAHAHTQREGQLRSRAFSFRMQDGQKLLCFKQHPFEQEESWHHRGRGEHIFR